MLAPGDRDHILSGVFNQFLSANPRASRINKKSANNPALINWLLLRHYRLNRRYLAGLQRNCLQLLSPETFTTQLKYSGIVKDAVQRTQQGSVFLKILAPESRVLVAGEDHIETAFFVVAPVNQVKEQSGILLVKGTVANLVNNQARGAHKAVEAGIGLSRTSGCRESVPEFGCLNEIGFQPMLAAGVSESLSQMRFACACRANKG